MDEVLRCESCPKIFDAKNKFNQHLKTHSKPYTCQSCEKRFALRADLHRHVKSRHRIGQMKFECGFESLNFKATRKDNLKQHKKLHSPDGESTPTRKSAPKNNASPTTSERRDQEIEELVQVPNPSSFMQAASVGSVVFLSHALHSGIDINTMTDDGYTALHCAARADQVESLKFLLSAGADHNCLSNPRLGSTGHQAIHEAVEGRSLQCFEILLNRSPQVALATNANFGSLLKSVVRAGDINLVKLLAKFCASNAEWTTDEWQVKLATEAAKAGRIDIVGFLLSEHHFSLVPAAKHSTHHSPLYQAAKNGQLAMVSSLLASRRMYEGEDDESRKRFTNLMSRSLRQAAKKGHAEIVLVLMEHGGHVIGQRALYHAASNGHTKAAEVLVHLPNIDINQASPGSDTALHLAARAGYSLIVELLLQQPGINSNLKNNEGETPFFAAFWENQLASARLLPAPPQQGSMYSVHASIAQLAKRFLLHGILHVDSWGSRKSLLHLAADLNDIELMTQILSHQDCRPEALTTTNYDGATPLEIAVAQGNLAMVDLLVAHGAIKNSLKSGRISQPETGRSIDRVSQELADSEIELDSAED